MSNNSASPLSNLAIDENKIQQFEQWCLDHNLNSQQVIMKVIDACLQNDLTIVDLLTNPNHFSQLDQQINFQIQKAITPLLQRIEQLESQINSNSNQKLQSTDLNLPVLNSEQPSEEQTQKINPDEITYLPRNEVWRRLKQTNYVNHSGYESFLRARGDEFIQYGIYFDREKKRYYVMNDNRKNTELCD